MRIVISDGGREAAGFKGSAGDCVTRAIAIATGYPYRNVYDNLKHLNKKYMNAHRCRTAKHLARGNTSPRNGVNKKIYRPYLLDNGFIWESYMGIGTGCQIHMREDELPSGILIVRVSRHLACVIDGVLYDTHDCTRNGTRCVYGAYRLLPDWTPAHGLN